LLDRLLLDRLLLNRLLLGRLLLDRLLMEPFLRGRLTGLRDRIVLADDRRRTRHDREYNEHQCRRSTKPVDRKVDAN